MTSPDTPDTARLRELLSKATPVPWAPQKPMDVPEDNGVAIIGLCLNEDGIPLYTPTNGLVAIACQLPTEIDAGDFTRALANASLLTAAVNALPALLDRIEALEAGLREVVSTNAENCRLRDLYAHHLRSAKDMLFNVAENASREADIDHFGSTNHVDAMLEMANGLEHLLSDKSSMAARALLEGER